MKKTYIFAFLILAFITASLLTSCTTSDEVTIIEKDTVFIVKEGTVKNQVNIETINKRFVIQIAAFSQQENVNTFLNQAKDKLNVMPDVRKYGNIYEVTVGNFTYANAAQDYLNVVKSKGFKDAFIKTVD